MIQVLNKKQILYRLKIIPQKIKDGISAGTKYHAEGFMDTLIKGLKAGNLVKPKLSSATLHIRKFYPEKNRKLAPLVGSGTLINNLEVIKEKKDQWVCRPNNKYAISEPPKGKEGKRSKITIRRLWRIHETGAIINVTPKMKSAFRYWFGITLKKKQIIIPARHAWKKARNRYLKSQAKMQADEKLMREIKKMVER